MKEITFRLKKSSLWGAILFIFLFREKLIAADKEIDININTGSTAEAPWYTSWWVWVIGLAVFVIILVAIISSGKRK